VSTNSPAYRQAADEVPLPAGWIWTNLGGLAEFINGDRGKNYPSGDAFVEHGIPFINAGHLVDGRVSMADMNFITEDRFDLLRSGKVKSGDILYCLRGSLGKAAVVTNIDQAAIASSLVILRTNGACLPPYAYSFLVSPFGRAMIERYDNGSAQPNLSGKNVEEYRVPLAPLGEQKRIVEVLDSYLTRLDAAAEGLRRVEANLKRYRSSVLKAAVEGRLVPTEADLAKRERRAYEPASVLLDRILKERRRRWEQAELAKMKAKGESPKNDNWKSKYQAPCAPDTTNLPALPEGWCWATVSALVSDEPQNGVYLPKTRYGSGTPILRIDDFQALKAKPASELQKVALDPAMSVQFALAPGDLVINRVNAPSHLGKCVVADPALVGSVCESNMMRLRLGEGVEPRYLASYLTSVDGNRRLTENAKWAVNQASINQQDVLRTPVPLPPLPEQTAIAEEVSRQLALAAHVSTEIDADRRSCARLRQSILTWAFEGKLVDQDPNDEPASVLLDRIRREGVVSAPEKTAPTRARRKRSA